MERFTGVIGIVLILALAYLMSKDRRAINFKTVGIGLLLQAGLAVFILRTDTGKSIFGWLGKAVTKVLDFSNEGGSFVFGVLSDVGDRKSVV